MRPLYSGLRLVFLTIVVFFLAGGNFITALLAAEILFANLLICLFQKNKLRLVAAVLFVVNLGGFLLSAFAPGNAFRQAEYEQFSPFKAIVYSFSEAYIFLEKYTSLYVILAVLFLVPFFWKMACCEGAQKITIPYFVYVMLAYCFFASSFTPNLYAYGNAGPGRIQNIRYWLMCILYVILAFLAVVRAKSLLSPQQDSSSGGQFGYLPAKSISFLCMILFMAVMFLFSDCREEYRDKLSTISALNSLQSGKAQAYDKEWDDRMEQLLYSDEQNLVFDKIKNKPHLLFFQDLYADETEWRNQVCAQYYKKQSVRTKKKKEK